MKPMAASRAGLAMLALLALLATGCEISPVVSAPLDGPGTRYVDCERAAEAYCEHSLKCLSSGARAASVSRS